MTNENDTQEATTCDPRMAALLAVHLVSQVLDDACVVVNAYESNQAQKYLSILNQCRNCCVTEELLDVNSTFTILQNSNHATNTNVPNAVATSTPQKLDDTKMISEVNFIGQGDEEFNMESYGLRKATSMLINHLFDMSDLEQVNSCNGRSECDLESENITDFLKTIIHSYVNSAIDIALEIATKDELCHNSETNFDVSEHSSYSLLEDAPFTRFENNSTVYMHNQEWSKNMSLQNVNPDDKESEITANITENNHKVYNTKYEDAYLTMNRDYDQYEDEEPFLQDPKTISLQEIELVTAPTPQIPQQKEKKLLTAVSGTSTGTHKSSIVQRCRVQGAKLLSCLKGMCLRRKLLRKNKRNVTSTKALCPFTPDGQHLQRRTSSFIDQRSLRTPSPSRPVIWKFNTVNEALVHSSRWRDFNYKMSLNENDEF